jgi:hypothetical protein
MIKNSHLAAFKKVLDSSTYPCKTIFKDADIIKFCTYLPHLHFSQGGLPQIQEYDEE